MKDYISILRSKNSMSITHVYEIIWMFQIISSTSRYNGKNIGSLFLVYVCKKQAIIFVFNFEKKMLI